MYTLFTILIVIAAVLLTLVVLAQNSKGGGLAANFAGANQVLGVRKATDSIEKLTWGLTGFIIVAAIFAASMSPYRNMAARSGMHQSAIHQQVQDAAQQQQQNMVVPGFGEFTDDLIIE